MKQRLKYLSAFGTAPLILKIPRSKSISHRHLFLKYLHRSKSSVHNVSDSRDTRLFQEALESKHFTIDFMDAGTPARFALAYFAICNIPKILKGNSSLQRRPVGDLVEALRAQGAKIRYLEQEGFFPLEIVHGIRKNDSHWILNTTESSQFVSALMLGITALTPIPDLQIVGLQHSWSYIRLSASVLKMWGYFVAITEGRIHIEAAAQKEVQGDHNLQNQNKDPLIEADAPNEAHGNHNLQNQDKELLKGASAPNEAHIDIEIDWGCASFMYLIALFTGKSLFIEGAMEHSPQADYAAVDAFRALGVHTQFEAQGARIIPVNILDIPEEFDGTDCPDLIPALVSAYAFLKIPMKFIGIDKLAGKESNRLQSMGDNLRALGFNWERSENAFLLSVNNPTPINNYSISTHHDHRIAMAFAPWSVCIDEVYIDDSNCTEKSFPGYWELLKMCNFELQDSIKSS